MESPTEKETELTPILMELAEAGFLDNACGTEVRHDDDGWYVAVIAIDPDLVQVPEEYKGVRLTVIKPPAWTTSRELPKSMSKIKREVRLEKPVEAPVLD
jgi:hypothetical protein